MPLSHKKVYISMITHNTHQRCPDIFNVPKELPKFIKTLTLPIFLLFILSTLLISSSTIATASISQLQSQLQTSSPIPTPSSIQTHLKPPPPLILHTLQEPPDPTPTPTPDPSLLALSITPFSKECKFFQVTLEDQAEELTEVDGWDFTLRLNYTNMAIASNLYIILTSSIQSDTGFETVTTQKQWPLAPYHKEKQKILEFPFSWPKTSIWHAPTLTRWVEIQFTPKDIQKASPTLPITWSGRLTATATGKVVEAFETLRIWPAQGLLAQTMEVIFPQNEAIVVPRSEFHVVLKGLAHNYDEAPAAESNRLQIASEGYDDHNEDIDENDNYQFIDDDEDIDGATDNLPLTLSLRDSQNPHHISPTQIDPQSLVPRSIIFSESTGRATWFISPTSVTASCLVNGQIYTDLHLIDDNHLEIKPLQYYGTDELVIKCTDVWLLIRKDEIRLSTNFYAMTNSTQEGGDSSIEQEEIEDFTIQNDDEGYHNDDILDNISLFEERKKQFDQKKQFKNLSRYQNSVQSSPLPSNPALDTITITKTSKPIKMRSAKSTIQSPMTVLQTPQPTVSIYLVSSLTMGTEWPDAGNVWVLIVVIVGVCVVVIGGGLAVGRAKKLWFFADPKPPQVQGRRGRARPPTPEPQPRGYNQLHD